MKCIYSYSTKGRGGWGIDDYREEGMLLWSIRMGMMEWKAMLREIHSSQCAGMGHKCVSRERIKEVGMRF